jgi:ABC-2 type transport system ATP-binding protein
LIKIQDLTKYYGRRLAVDNIGFSVEKGEIVGFLGPNGAGKTTTMRIITGYLMPSHGQVWIGDYNMRSQSLQSKRLIGYLPEVVPLYTDMTTRTYLEFTARLRGLDREQTRRRVEEVVAQCALGEYVDILLGKLSKGFKQRVGLAQAIIHDPQVLILDEPTIGIDPIQVAQTRQLIKTLGQDRTILLSTHILPEVSMICRRVIIIHEGKIVAKDRIENLSMLLKGGKRLRLKVKGPADKVADSLRRISSVREVSYEQPYHIVEFASDQEPQAEITKILVRNGWTLLAMESAEMSLEDIFLQLTNGEEQYG